MRVSIIADQPGEGLVEAVEYARAHVIVPRADLAKVRAWAKSKGLLKEVQALGVVMHEISVSGHPPTPPKRSKRAKVPGRPR